MIRIALLDPELASAVTREQSLKGGVGDLSVVWSGTDPDALLAADLVPPPDVLVVDRARLPADASKLLARLRSRFPARTVITTYTFARRDEIEALRRAGSDVVVQGPMSVRTLRTFLLSLLIERRMQRPPPQPVPGPNTEDGPVVEPRFTRQQLLALRDIQSAIQCECPNHIAELVERLLAFEAYAKNCENRNEQDAVVHRTLWFATARARRIMEDALEKLIEHEGILVDGDTVRRGR